MTLARQRPALTQGHSPHGEPAPFEDFFLQLHDLQEDAFSQRPAAHREC